MPFENYHYIQKFNLDGKLLREQGKIEAAKKRIVDELLVSSTPTSQNAFQSKGFKAVTVCFSDIEGRLHMLDYDKDFLLQSTNNLTFDGSSIRGFTKQHESDLKLNLDWTACYMLPGEFFGNGKLYIFGEVQDKDGSDYSSDLRSTLRRYLQTLRDQQLLKVNIAAEIEGFLFKGADAEKTYHEHKHFEYLTSGGYFNTLPQSQLRLFIDTVAEIQRAVGFKNEKDHPEVAPSQFEINWSYTDALIAADQIQLYKLICRQVADRMGLTACFLPKPIVGVNGNGMHTNISLSDTSTFHNLFHGREDFGLSTTATNFMNGLLNCGEDICLALNSSVNAYRRLDPHYEAPNQIKASAVDRGSMIRIPLGNANSARLEVRTVAPDANPYLAILAILHAGFSYTGGDIRPTRMLPTDIYSAIECFDNSQLMSVALGEDTKKKYIAWKEESANRCPRLLGTSVKEEEIMYHHEVTNQQLWNMF